MQDFGLTLINKYAPKQPIMSATRGKEESKKLILLEVETIEWKIGGGSRKMKKKCKKIRISFENVQLFE